MKRIAAIIYQSYSEKKIDMPYFRTIISFEGLIIIHLLILYAAFKIPKSFNPFSISETRSINYIYTGIFILLLTGILSLFFKRKQLEAYEFREDELKQGSRNILIYFIVSVIILLLLAIFKVRNRW